METIQVLIDSLLGAPFDLNVRYSLFYLCCSTIIAFLVWKYQGTSGSFIKWLVPKEVYRHRSNLLDIKLFFASRMFIALGFTSAVFFPTTVAYTLLLNVASADFTPPPITWQRGLIVTLIIVVTSDFCKYWAHRAHHEWGFLWPFHAVHHSADVLTPLTVQRVHPVEPMIRNLLMTVLVGIVQGLVLYAFIGQINIATIGGANALYFIFNALGANFRHSHIWISYGPIIERILISPAQHQVHHSVAVKHHDKNYGSMFAIWDWMFGTLYIPTEREKLIFGVSDGTGKPAEQPYPTLVAALILPFRESWRALAKQMKPNPRLTQPVAPGNLAMTQGFSLWLDVLRAAAALAVLFGHMAHIRFTRGDYYFLREWNIASDAVVVFFVLSGVVIAYAAGRDQTLERFAFNRVTRIASVLVPALLVTLIFDAIGTRIDMTAYPEHYYQALPVGEFLWRGLTATNLWTGVSDWVRLGTNGPIWSLSYEVGFYLMFGSIMFLRGAMRIVVLATLVLLVGIPVLALFPVWWLGVIVWRNAPSSDTSAPSRAWSWLMVVSSLMSLVTLKASGLPQLLEHVTQQALQPMSHHTVLVYSNEVLWNSVIAICIAIHLVGVRRLAMHAPQRTKGRVARAMHWVAGGSFSIYVMHYPTLHLLDATLPKSLPGYDLWLLGLTLTVCFAFAALFERTLKPFRMYIKIFGSRVAEAMPGSGRAKSWTS